MRTDEYGDLVAQHLARWDLDLVGEAWSTPSSRLARVRRRSDGRLAVLKVPTVEEERLGCLALAWWSGRGAAPVLEIDPGAVLIEHADRPARTLAVLATSASPPTWETDARATRTLVEVTRRLHQRPQVDVPEGLVPLRRWFRDLFALAAEPGGFVSRAATLADELLDHQQDRRVLHGDVHHENVLWFGPEQGWLAIDPKGLFGDPAFDYVNILCNPTTRTALRPGRLEEHVDLIAAGTGIGRVRLLSWTVAWAGLSAAWYGSSELGGHASAVVEVGLAAERALAREVSAPPGTGAW